MVLCSHEVYSITRREKRVLGWDVLQSRKLRAKEEELLWMHRRDSQKRKGALRKPGESKRERWG